MVPEIGRAAGDVWHYLNSNGASTVERIKKALALKDAVLCMAVGWLAREGKLSFEVEDKTLRISLLPQEVAL
jgi:Winged helix-turn-helix domain (DUF2582)